jgi:RAB protein geranylgeranyltransferase component A
LNELLRWAQSNPTGFSSIAFTGGSLSNSQQYSLSLTPGILPSIGPLINALVDSGVSKYGSFKLLESVNVFHSLDNIEAVPSVKEDVFRTKSMSLIEKRKLMRFLVFASGDGWESSKEMFQQENVPFPEFLRKVFNLTDDLITVITYALAFCSSASDPTFPALQRVRAHLRAAGKYGPSSFLVGHYGGAGEIAQGFCRAAAVSGGIYILDKAVKDISFDEPISRYTIELQEFPELLTAKVLITEQACTAQSVGVTPTELAQQYSRCAVARCIAIVDQPLSFPQRAAARLGSLRGREEGAEETGDLPTTVNTFVVVFPPEPTGSRSRPSSVLALVTGSDTMSCPQGKWIIYISCQLTESVQRNPGSNQEAQSMLQPYLEALLSCRHKSILGMNSPLFSLFYIQESQSYGPQPLDTLIKDSHIMSPPGARMLHESLDSAAEIGESLYRYSVKILDRSTDEFVSSAGERCKDGEAKVNFWPPNQHQDTDDD